MDIHPSAYMTWVDSLTHTHTLTHITKPLTWPKLLIVSTYQRIRNIKVVLSKLYCLLSITTPWLPNNKQQTTNNKQTLVKITLTSVTVQIFYQNQNDSIRKNKRKIYFSSVQGPKKLGMTPPYNLGLKTVSFPHLNFQNKNLKMKVRK